MAKEGKKGAGIAIVVGVLLLGGLGYLAYKKGWFKKKSDDDGKKALKDAYDNLQFEVGKDVIVPSSFIALAGLAAVLNQSPTWKLGISGHTDNTGSEAFNERLSLNRAQSVKDFLITKGVTQDRIATTGHGSTKPIADNTTADGRALNRRVEFTIVKEEGDNITT
jgi:outer membrane protein OmpA-like peptidoglycan-associated protein